MKKIINYLKKIFKIKEDVKHEYIVILKSGEQSINFEATSKEFKKLFKTLKGIKVFKADNVIVPLSSILYWYIETEETKKIKEENFKREEKNAWTDDQPKMMEL